MANKGIPSRVVTTRGGRSGGENVYLGNPSGRNPVTVVDSAKPSGGGNNSGGGSGGNSSGGSGGSSGGTSSGGSSGGKK